MLWYKSWLETRWRFLVGLALMACSAAEVVLVYPKVRALLPLVPPDVPGELGRQIHEAAALASSYGGYVWSHGFRENLSQLGTLFAVLLGTAGLLSRSGGALFTLSLPVSRLRLLGVRFTTAVAELFALTFASALLIPMLSPAIGARYDVGSALAHGACLFVASSVFLSLALFLTVLFDDPWKPLLGAIAAAIGLALVDPLLRAPSWSVFAVMSGETYFRAHRLPWGGLLLSAAASAGLVYAAAATLRRRDF
jgi:hypothetical protein